MPDEPSPQLLVTPSQVLGKAEPLVRFFVQGARRNSHVVLGFLNHSWWRRQPQGLGDTAR